MYEAIVTFVSLDELTAWTYSDSTYPTIEEIVTSLNENLVSYATTEEVVE